MKIKVLKESKYTPFICTVIALVLVVSLLLTLRVLNTNSKSVKLSDKDIAKISNGVETAISNNIDNTVTQDVVYKYLDSYFTEDKVEEIAEEYVEVISGGGQLSDVKFDDNGNPIPSEDSGELEEDGNHSNKDDNKDSNITYKNEDYNVNSDTDLEKLKLSIVDTINDKLVEVKNNISQMSFNVSSMSSDVKNQIAKEVSNSLVNLFNTVSNNNNLDKSIDKNKIKNIMMSELSDFEFNLSSTDVTNISDVVNNSFSSVQNDLKGVSDSTIVRLNDVQQNLINKLESEISKPVSLNTSDYNNIVNTLSASVKRGTDGLEEKLKQTNDTLSDNITVTKESLLTSIGTQSTTLTTLIGDKTDILQNQNTQLSQDLTSKTDALNQSLTNKTDILNQSLTTKTDTLNQSLNTSTNNITNSLTTGFSTQSSAIEGNATLIQSIKDAIGNPDYLDYSEGDINTPKTLVSYFKEKFSSIFNRMDDQEKILYGTIPQFDSTKSYSVGDVVIKDGVLYECINNSSGEWSDSNWKQTSVFQSASDSKKELAETITGLGGEISGDFTISDMLTDIKNLAQKKEQEGYNKGYAKGKSDATITVVSDLMTQISSIWYKAGETYPMGKLDITRGTSTDHYYYLTLSAPYSGASPDTGDRYYFYDMLTGSLVLKSYYSDLNARDHCGTSPTLVLHGRIVDLNTGDVLKEGTFSLLNDESGNYRGYGNLACTNYIYLGYSNNFIGIGNPTVVEKIKHDFVFECTQDTRVACYKLN